MGDQINSLRVRAIGISRYIDLLIAKTPEVSEDRQASFLDRIERSLDEFGRVLADIEEAERVAASAGQGSDGAGETEEGT